MLVIMDGNPTKGRSWWPVQPNWPCSSAPACSAGATSLLPSHPCAAGPW